MPAPDDRPNLTSVTLLERLRGGDQDAWRRLVALYGPLVRHWTGRRGVTGADADDVSQDVFRAAAAGLERFRRDRPGDTFRGWLRGITRNVLLAHHRQAGEGPHAAGGSAAREQIEALPDRAADPADEADPPAEVRGLFQRGLELVRGEFEERTWRAFWQHAVDGRAVADVAADLGVSAASVRQSKSRVLRRLREELGDLAE